MSAGGMKLEQMQRFFFDREAVRTAVEPRAHRALARVLAFTMRRARKSIKLGQGVSPPGRPPTAHAFALRAKVNSKGKASTRQRALFPDTILFAYEPDKGTGVAGPYLYNGARARPTVPELQEVGGDAAGDGGRVLHYRPHPFMQPAFAEELKRLPATWGS